MRELGERRSPRTIILNVDPLKSRVFRRHVRKYLFEDFAARFRDVPEILTQMAWLLGGDAQKDTGKFVPLESLAEQFGRTDR